MPNYLDLLILNHLDYRHGGGEIGWTAAPAIAVRDIAEHVGLTAQQAVHRVTQLLDVGQLVIDQGNSSNPGAWFVRLAGKGREVLAGHLRELVYEHLVQMFRGAAGTTLSMNGALPPEIGRHRTEMDYVLSWMQKRGAVKIAEAEGLSSGGTDFSIVAVRPEVAELPDSMEETAMAAGQKDPRSVFVVHGRNTRLRDDMFAFLRALNLKPIEWSEALDATGAASPYIGGALNAALGKAAAVVVMMTPDDLACLRKNFWEENEKTYEKELTGQARPNVLFEAGLAFGKQERSTVLVQVGELRPFSDVFGRHVVRLNNTPESRNELASKLQTAGCSVETLGNDWLKTGDFEIKDDEMPLHPEVAAFLPTGSISGLSALDHGTSESPELTDFQVEYLMTIGRPRNKGSIGGHIDDREGREAAQYQEALEEFQQLGIMRFDGRSYKLTGSGWKLADRLWALRILDALDPARFLDYEELGEAVELTDGETELAELKRHLEALEGTGLVKVARTMRGGSVKILGQGVTARNRREVTL